MSNGYPWRTHRKFAGIHLRTVGEGKKVLELNIQQECVYLCDAFKAEKGRLNVINWITGAKKDENNLPL